jgi:uncharacterized protein YjdB
MSRLVIGGMMRRANCVGLAATLAILVCACNGDSPGDPGVSVPTSIALNRSVVGFSAIGDTATLAATVLDAGGRPISDVTIAWATSDGSVALISQFGLVTAVQNGDAVITARSGALEASASVTVSQEAHSIVIPHDTIRFASLEDTATVSASVRDANGNELAAASVAWTSADSAIALVSPSGLITAVGNGTTAVTARSGSAWGTGFVSVAQVPASIVVNGSPTRTLALGDSIQLVADVHDANARQISGAAVTWSSSDNTAATVDAMGVVRPRRAGAVTITAVAGGHAGAAAVGIQILNVKIETIPPVLASPAPGALWEIPVVIIRYIPTLDGVNVDAGEAGISGTLGQIRKRIEAFEERIKFMLEERSRFRGYQDAAAPYSLGYRVVHIVTVFSHFQRGNEVPWNPGHYFPDYHQILGQVDAEAWVNDHGVKEFWVWGYHSDLFEQPESNMSSPVTGDISNSSRFPDDLPIYNHTYTVYGYNFGRTQAEVLHVHGHQLEALLSHIDHGLFWREFVGRNATDTDFSMGRAGWTHMPPNTLQHYDYLNSTVVPSDIRDWRPGGGATEPVSRSTWASVAYEWPSSRAPGEVDIWQRDESQWYMYWMQSMPGHDNAIPHGSGGLTNWWRLTGDWDGAIRDGYGLSTSANTITIRNDYEGGVLLSPGGGLSPGERATLRSSVPMTVAVWDCGEPGGCKMDPYVLHPGRAYRVITDPSGPAANLTIVEIVP